MGARVTCAKLEGINVQTGHISAEQAPLDESIASITSAECLLCGCFFPLQTLWVVDSQWGGQVGRFIFQKSSVKIIAKAGPRILHILACALVFDADLTKMW